MRTIILSSDDSKMIKNYPYVAWAWNELGWHTHLFYLGKHSVLLEEFKKIKKYFNTSKNQIHSLPTLEGYANDIVLNAAKLFGGFCYWDDRILMTADMNILPCEDYWTPNKNELYINNSISRYLAMSASDWRLKMETGDKTIMDEELKLFLDKNPDFKDIEEVNRTIALNNSIIKTFIPKNGITPMLYFPNNVHLDLEDMCRTEDKIRLKNILKHNFEKIPSWM